MTVPDAHQLDPGHALVPGGGVNGIAWMTGLLLGFEDQGVHLAGADRVIGTSAGSILGARGLTKRLAREIAEPQAEGSRASVITASRAARAAMGRNPLSRANRPMAAWAGLAQASEIAEEVRASWT